MTTDHVPQMNEKGASKRQRSDDGTDTPDGHASKRRRSRDDSKAPPKSPNLPSFPTLNAFEPSERKIAAPRKRPGATSKIDTAAKEAIQRRQEAREIEAKVAATTRGVHDVVKQHYNAVPQRGREWRKTESRIKGLRGLNNWVKSTIIHKFSPDNDTTAGPRPPLLVLDIGCGKGGDLAKWAQAPQQVDLYVGIDPAEVSIEQAQERYGQMGRGGGRGGRGGRGGGRGPGRGGGHQSSYDARFVVQDAFNQTIGSIPIVREVGFDASGGNRWSGGGFDVVSMMFCVHYAFEDEKKARMMLQNITGALKKGGRFLGTVPNSDILRENVEQFHKRQEARSAEIYQARKSSAEAEHAEEVADEDIAHWGNSIYQVRFPGKTPADGVFRPPFGWKYNYFLDEAVEVPEYVVPWEAFRALAEDYNLELQYRKPFPEIWKEEKDHPAFRSLSERMGVVDRISGELLVTQEEMEAVGFYHAFCFYKV
ncbi:MAG: hypothetical protein Q9220_000374 [cf. Caloplaca sp. 1 TL-2023]